VPGTPKYTAGTGRSSGGGDAGRPCFALSAAAAATWTLAISRFRMDLRTNCEAVNANSDNPVANAENPPFCFSSCQYSLPSPQRGNAVTFLNSFIIIRRRLRSTSSPALLVPPTRRTTIGDRSFPVAGTRVWNALPSLVTDSSTTSASKRHLKTTYLFARSLS